MGPLGTTRQFKLRCFDIRVRRLKGPVALAFVSRMPGARIGRAFAARGRRGSEPQSLCEHLDFSGARNVARDWDREPVLDRVAARACLAGAGVGPAA